MLEPAANSKVSIAYAERVNYSLCHAGLDHVIRSIEVPPGLRGHLRIAGCSERIPLPSGRTGRFSPLLDAHMFARLTAPIETQLILELEGEDPEIHPVVVSPLCAWRQCREHGLATAAFVLENDPVIAQLVHEAGTTPVAGAGRPPEDAARQLYTLARKFFGPCYLFERMVFPPEEQAIRFPLQMKCDLGGTCIDFSLAYAAALFRSGIEPLLVILDDERGSRHALVGIWLAEVPCARKPLPEPRLLRKAFEEGLWVALEVTATTRGCSYSEARHLASEQIERNRIDWAVDVKAARCAEVHALPGRPCTTTFNHWEVRSLDERTRTMTGAAIDCLRSLRVEVVESAHPGDIGKSWELEGFRATIGRGHRHDIGLLEPTVSDPHAVIYTEGTEIRIADLLSKAGVRLGQSRVPPNGGLPIQAGQTFQTGRVTLRLNRSSERS